MLLLWFLCDRWRIRGTDRYGNMSEVPWFLSNLAKLELRVLASKACWPCGFLLRGQLSHSCPTCLLWTWKHWELCNSIPLLHCLLSKPRTVIVTVFTKLNFRNYFTMLIHGSILLSCFYYHYLFSPSFSCFNIFHFVMCSLYIYVHMCNIYNIHIYKYIYIII